MFPEISLKTHPYYRIATNIAAASIAAIRIHTTTVIKKVLIIQIVAE